MGDDSNKKTRIAVCKKVEVSEALNYRGRWAHHFVNVSDNYNLSVLYCWRSASAWLSLGGSNDGL